MKLVEKYYRFQRFVDIGWGELNWWYQAIVDLVVLIVLLKEIGIIVEGSVLWAILLIALLVFYILGRILKATKIYDTSEYVGANIDPVSKINLEASKIIIEKFGGEKNEIFSNSANTT